MNRRQGLLSRGNPEARPSICLGLGRKYVHMQWESRTFTYDVFLLGLIIYNLKRMRC
jgi:hypothetical protein